MRAVHIIFLPVLAGCLLSACGGDDNAKGPPGSQSNTLVAQPNPSATRTAPTEQSPGERAMGTKTGSSGSQQTALKSSSTRTQQGSAAKKGTTSSETDSATRPETERKQKALPPSASRPCSLVSKTQARAIIGAPILEPLQAPQGPTCIYQTKSGKPYVMLLVQTVKFARLRKQIRNPRAVSIADRTAYCGTYGKPMLYLPVAGGRVLSISASCDVATQFAAKAAPHL